MADKFKLGEIYNHTGRDPHYGRGFKCVFITESGWAVLQPADVRCPPKLELPTFWVIGDVSDYKIEPLRTGTQMDYMESDC